MKASQKLGLMALMLGMTAAIFGRKKQASATPYRPIQGGTFWNPQAIFIPRRTHFKGYQKDNRNWGRKRKAA